jgi:hypothetical protein
MTFEDYATGFPDGKCYFSAGPPGSEGGDTAVFLELLSNKLLDADGIPIAYDPAVHGDMIMDSIVGIEGDRIHDVTVAEARTRPFFAEFRRNQGF